LCDHQHRGLPLKENLHKKLDNKNHYSNKHLVLNIHQKKESIAEETCSIEMFLEEYSLKFFFNKLLRKK